ncbi:MAG TPA: AI-2E family transporter, partial [Candidatus Saccharimonadales bacterium]|nr:AI-2E family transporter [Candidatus Saccharimonadales bacterium]
MNDRKVTVNLTNRTIVRAILWIVATILIYHFVGRITHELTLIFAAFFLAMALNPGVGALSRHLRIKSRGYATALAYLIIIGFITLFLVLIVPPLVRQTRTFISSVPDTIQNFQNKNSKLAQASRRYHLDQKISQGAKDFASHYNNIGSTLFDTGKRIAEVIVSIVAVLVMTFMMLVEGPRWLEL